MKLNKRQFEMCSKTAVLQCNRFLSVGLFVLLLSACGSDPGSGSDSLSKDKNTISSTATTDIAIATALYFDQRTPDDFYKEEYQDGRFHTANHVRNIDLIPIADRPGVSVYELTSDNFNEAMNWSEQSAAFQDSYKQLVDNSETLLYHQFTRVDLATPQFVHLNRVLKASALNRNGVNDSYKGRITLANMTAADVKLIIEYLWTFTIDNNYGNAVLSTSITETADEFVYVMQQARLTSSFDDSCDAIEIYDVHYTVPKASGFIWRTKVLMREIFTKRSGDFLEVCGS